MPSNPYASPYPVKQPTFLFGRERFMKNLIERVLGVEYQVSQQIVGLTRSGKTSILNCIARLGDKDSRLYMLRHFGLDSSDLVDLTSVIFVQVDCTGMPSNTDVAFWTLVAHKLVTAVEASQPGRLVPTAANDLGVFAEVYSALRQLAKEHALVVILFDEFDKIIEALPTVVLDILRFLLDDLSGNLVYVTATRREWRELHRLESGGRSPISSNIMTYFDHSHYVGLLERAGVERYIRSIADHFGVRFMDQDIEFALLVGGRHPDLTRIACKHIYDARLLQSGGDLDYQVVSNKLLVDFEGFYLNFWPELSVDMRRDLTRLVTEGSSDIDRDSLRTMEALGLIVSTGSAFSLFSPIFEQFLLREKRGAVAVQFAAQSSSQVAQLSSAIPRARVFVQRDRRLQLALYVPFMVLFAIITWIATVLVLGEARLLPLVQIVNPVGALVAAVLDLSVVGLAMWRVLLFVQRVAERRRQQWLSHSKHAQTMEAQARETTRRDVILEVLISSLAGVISALIAAFILHFFH